MTKLFSFLSDKAIVLHKSDGEICFQVDDVQPLDKHLSMIDVRSKVTEILGGELLAFSHDNLTEVVSAGEVCRHGLVNAVHLAFSEHRPLVLTPDIIWLTLAQGFAHHITNHAEALRSRFVNHKGRSVLLVETKEFSSPEHWMGVIQDWGTAIAEHVGSEIYRILVSDFSTTTPVARTASQVVMMDAFQEYFDYQVMLICGIPSVTLKGSIADWIRIRERVDFLENYHLEWWTERLKPICDGLVNTAKGLPSRTFWQHIYIPKEVYGGKVITGWLADLFPYVNDPVANTPTVRNRILTIPPENRTVGHGLRPKVFPTGLSQAPFILQDAGTRRQQHLELVAGFVGVLHNSTTGAVEPEIGWAVRERDRFCRLLDDLAPKQGRVSGTESSAGLMGNRAFAWGMPKEVIHLAQRFNGRHTFFAASDHPWHLKAASDFTPCELLGTELQSKMAIHFMDLRDERAVAYAPVWQHRQT